MCDAPLRMYNGAGPNACLMQSAWKRKAFSFTNETPQSYKWASKTLVIGMNALRLPFVKRWRYKVECEAVRVLIGVLQLLGPVRASNAMGAFCRAIGPFLPVTRVAQANLRAAFPGLSAPERARIIRGMWENLGRTAGEFPHLADLPKDSPEGPGWEVVNEHLLHAQAIRGGPAIFVSGHISNWELLPPVVARYGMPFSSVYREAANTSVDKVIFNLRCRAIGQAVPMFAKGAKGARAAFTHLGRGGYLGMLIDQKMNDGIEARLFGLPAMTAPAAAALALRFGCPVIPGRVQRIGPARLRLIVNEPLLPPLGLETQEAVALMTQAINDLLERWIRERPAEWLWVHRRFPKHVINTSQPNT